MKAFTDKQEAQIRKALDRLMQVGTAHISLFEATENYYDSDNGVMWWKVKARLPYELYNSETGEIYTDDKIYEISVGVLADRRRHVYTALNLSQHDTRHGICRT